MRRFLAIVSMLSLGAVLAAGQSRQPSVEAAQSSADRVKATADAATPKQCTEKCIDAARQFADLSDLYFKSGDVEKAREAMKESGVYAQKAARSSVQARHRQKKTEIALRKLTQRITDIRQTITFEDRPVVDEVLDGIEKARNELLDSMFGNPAKTLSKENE